MSRFEPSSVLELLKPVTWFAPVWAFACGVVSSGLSLAENWMAIIAGIGLAGPLVCGTSQAVNDWYDRSVDAINEPQRPIPSGRIPGRWGLYIAVIWTAVSLAVAATLGRWVFGAAIVALILAWVYSAPPIRLKRNGWFGNLAVAGCYEGLPWLTGAALMAAALPDTRILLLALVYSLGAHGIMTVNDFKSVEGDRRMGIRSLPVQLGVAGAARFTALAMIAAQIVVVFALALWDRPIHAGIVAALTAGQAVLAPKFVARPRELAPWFNGTGILLYVIGMLVSAFAVRSAPLPA